MEESKKLSITSIIERFMTTTPPLRSVEVLVPEPLLRNSPLLSSLPGTPTKTRSGSTATNNSSKRRTDSAGSTNSATTASSVAASIDVELRKLSKVAMAFRENYIWNEIRAMEKLAPSGVYVAPRFDNISEWDGIVFIAGGPFAGGMFRFRLLLDAQYPETVPRVLFVVPPFHPFIDADGWLQTHRAVPVWIVNKTYIHHILMYIKRILYQVSNDDDAANVDASFYLTRDENEFHRRVQLSVAKSRAAATATLPAHLRSSSFSQSYEDEDHQSHDDDPDPDDPLKMTEVDDRVVAKIVGHMKKYMVKVEQTAEERDVDLWLPDFLEDLQETVEQR